MADFIKEHGSEVENMLFTEFNIDDALEVRYEEGCEKGSLTKLIQQVLRKLEKGKNPEIIAEELDEKREIIQKICIAVNQCEPGADPEQIYLKFQGEDYE